MPSDAGWVLTPHLIAEIRTKVHSELQSCLDTRVAEEGCAVQAAMAGARDCIDNQAPVEHEWILRVCQNAPWNVVLPRRVRRFTTLS